MSLALASRGYLCPQSGGAVATVPGPVIIASDAIVPNLIGANLVEAEGPTISGSGVQAPQIGGGAASQSPAAGPVPVIDGGGVQAPNIDGSEED